MTSSPSDPDGPLASRDSLPGIESSAPRSDEINDLPARIWREVGPGIVAGLLAALLAGPLCGVIYLLQFGSDVNWSASMIRQFLTEVLLSGLMCGAFLGVSCRRFVRGAWGFNPAVAGFLAGILPGMYGVVTLAKQKLPFVGTTNLILSPLLGALVLQTSVIRNALLQEHRKPSVSRIAVWSLLMLLAVGGVSAVVFLVSPPLFEVLKTIYFEVDHLLAGAVCGAIFGGIVGIHTLASLWAVRKTTPIERLTRTTQVER